MSSKSDVEEEIAQQSGDEGSQQSFANGQDEEENNEEENENSVGGSQKDNQSNFSDAEENKSAAGSQEAMESPDVEDENGSFVADENEEDAGSLTESRRASKNNQSLKQNTEGEDVEDFEQNQNEGDENIEVSTIKVAEDNVETKNDTIQDSQVLVNGERKSINSTDKKSHVKKFKDESKFGHDSSINKSQLGAQDERSKTIDRKSMMETMKKKVEASEKQAQEDNQKAEAANEEGRKMIIIECCINCITHEYCTHHKEEKYEEAINQLRKELEALDPEYYVSKNFKIKKPRLGAFEVFSEGNLVYSKLKTLQWPNYKALAKKIHEPGEVDIKENKIKSKKFNSSRNNSTKKNVVKKDNKAMVNVLQPSLDN